MTDINLPQIIENENDDVYKAISQFYELEEQNIKTKTDIPNNSIKQILRIYSLSNVIKDISPNTSKIIDQMLDEYYHLRISKDRQGRKEFFNAIAHSEKNEEKKGLLRSILGR